MGKKTLLLVTRRENARNRTFARQSERLAADFEREGYLVTITDEPGDLSGWDRVVCTWWPQLRGVTVPSGVEFWLALYDHLSWKVTGSGFADLARRADRVCYSNLLMREELRLFGLERDKLFYLPDTVDMSHFRPSPYRNDSSQLIVGWVGDSREGVKRPSLIESLRQKLVGTSVRLVTADSATEGTYVPFDDMLAWYQGLDLLLVVSECEGTPNPLLEALSCGVPVWSTAVGLSPEIASRYPQCVRILTGTPSLGDLATELRRVRREDLLAAKRLCREAVAPYGWKGGGVGSEVVPRRHDVEKARVALVIDNPEWAFSRIAAQVTRYVVEVEFRTFLYPELRPGDLDGFDLILSFGYHPYKAIRYALRGLQVPIVTSVFDDYMWHEGQGRALLEEAADGSVAIAGCNSTLVEKLTQAFPGKRVYSIPDGVDLGMFQAGKRQRTGKAGWCGNTKYHQAVKGLDLVRTSVPGSALVILDAAEGATPHSDMPSWYGGIDFYCCASTAEGTPNPVLESLASGVPVIVPSGVGIVPDLPKSLGIVRMVDRDPETWRKVIASLLAEPEKTYRKRAKAARKAVEAWGWETQAENYRRMIREVVSCK